MLNEMLRNGSGYWDGVAYEAMKSLDKKKEVKEMLDIRRGDVIEYDTARSGKHIIAVVVSADKYNQDCNCKIVTTCILAERKTTELCIPFNFREKKYINCGSLACVYKESCVNILRTLKDEEIEEVNKMIMKAFGFEPAGSANIGESSKEKEETYKYSIESLKAENSAIKGDVERLKSENKKLFDNNVDLEKRMVEAGKYSEADFIRLEAERDIYKELYMNAINERG